MKQALYSALIMFIASLCIVTPILIALMLSGCATRGTGP